MTLTQKSNEYMLKFFLNLLIDEGTQTDVITDLKENPKKDTLQMTNIELSEKMEAKLSFSWGGDDGKGIFSE